jgi:glycosyltransferase involved in cell wall biosynthesis
LEITGSVIFNDKRVCILIPTYNNSGTLAKVIVDVLRFTTHIIVVNDGSTDGTSEILVNYPQLDVISYSKNKGKGYTLKKGFEFAKGKGYDYAITIDSDEQHSPDDLPAFIEKLKEEPEAIIIGSRNMDKEGVPGKSRYQASRHTIRIQTLPAEIY